MLLFVFVWLVVGEWSLCTVSINRLLTVVDPANTTTDCQSVMIKLTSAHFMPDTHGWVGVRCVSPPWVTDRCNLAHCWQWQRSSYAPISLHAHPWTPPSLFHWWAIFITALYTPHVGLLVPTYPCVSARIAYMRAYPCVVMWTALYCLLKPVRTARSLPARQTNHLCNQQLRLTQPGHDSNDADSGKGAPFWLWLILQPIYGDQIASKSQFWGSE